ncbi:FecR family protein [Arundinibacter roseus]|uniref:DUF4974 domain-containing protein n=1 Tax=Arundinibacter roseus TaxID=2070510 RepID=A0A4R4KH86_9BACT|nr:FecR domain-containing protein [Arundinibacter roseus]TDB65939.1 DUF4974 domain-containing protein [Arundinibacter roseus]
MKNAPFPPELLQRYLNQQCTDTERQMIDDWYRSVDFESSLVGYEFQEERLFEQIRAQIAVEEQADILPLKTTRRWRFWVPAAAAVAILALGFAYLMLRLPAPALLTSVLNDSPALVEFVNTQKKVVRYTLPDSSTLWLYPGAKLSYEPALAEAASRKVWFEGEGFFDVARDETRPFIVYSDDLKTEVLGTSFHVKAYKNDPTYEVSVLSGSVAVSNSDEAQKTEKVVLKPSQQAIFEKTTQRISTNTLPEYTPTRERWQPATLAFEDAPLAEVIAQLDTVFKVQLVVANPALKNCRLTVDFTQQRLPEMLEMINTLLNTTYEMDGTTIRLSGEGCAM